MRDYKRPICAVAAAGMIPIRKINIVSGLLASALLSIGQWSVAAVLTFDDLSGYYPAVPATYDGFNFTGWYVDSTCSGTSATGACSVYPYQPESLPTSIFSLTNANSISSVADKPFVFEGAYFTGFSGVTEQFDLYLGGSLVGTSSSLTLNGSETPAFLSSGYSGKVDKVVVASNSIDRAVMDNFTYVSSVPEPATLPLILGGLTGIVLLRRRIAA